MAKARVTTYRLGSQTDSVIAREAQSRNISRAEVIRQAISQVHESNTEK